MYIHICEVLYLFPSFVLLSDIEATNLDNPLHPTGLSLYPMKISENQRFSNIFSGSRKRPVE